MILHIPKTSVLKPIELSWVLELVFPSRREQEKKLTQITDKESIHLTRPSPSYEARCSNLYWVKKYKKVIIFLSEFDPLVFIITVVERD